MAKRRFARPAPSRSYRKVFIIATEGNKTEPAYFDLFKYSDKHTLTIIPSKDRTVPEQVLKRAVAKVQKVGIRKGDEAWIVIDRDTWTEEQMARVVDGCKDAGYFLAVSNPKFEYWLLLHFEDGAGIAGDCLSRLKQHLPYYEKGRLEIEKLRPGVGDAIARAKARHARKETDIPEGFGSTVYRLVEKLRD